MPTLNDLLKYGKILTDDEFVELEGGSIVQNTCFFTRIRTIKYEGHVYYHKMIDGEIAVIKELM